MTNLFPLENPQEQKRRLTICVSFSLSLWNVSTSRRQTVTITSVRVATVMGCSSSGIDGEAENEQGNLFNTME